MSLSNDPVHVLPATHSLRRSRQRWRIAAFVALAIAAAALAGRFALEAGDGETDRIARVVIEGVITTDRQRLAVLKDLGDNDHVKAVIVAINSPGGSTAGGEELYEALSVLREKKPVVAVVNELGASAAYMTAIAAERIYARRLSIVGSIGVLYQHVDAGKLLATIGIDFDKVATGPLKAEPDIDEPLAGAVRASMQRLVDDSFGWFVDIVSERRGLTRARTLELSDGRIVTGQMGLADGLIDAIGGEAEAVTWLEDSKEVPAGLDVVTQFPLPAGKFDWIGRYLGSQVRIAAGLSSEGPIALDGLVSLWQATSTE
jgi:protease IV